METGGGGGGWVGGWGWVGGGGGGKGGQPILLDKEMRVLLPVVNPRSTALFAPTPLPTPFPIQDFNEEDWTASFWGASNYARLQAIKAAYDPTGVFVCHHCVELPATSAASAAGVV